MVFKRGLTGFFTSANTLKNAARFRRSVDMAETAIAVNTEGEAAKKISVKRFFRVLHDLSLL